MTSHEGEAPLAGGETPLAGGEAPLAEQRVDAGRAWATRLHADGRVDEWSEAEGWQPLVRVAGDEVAGFAALVRSSGFFDLPSTLEGGADDAPRVAWTVDLDGRHHHVESRETGPAANRVLRDLDAELQRIVGEALNREADAEPADEGPGAAG